MIKILYNKLPVGVPMILGAEYRENKTEENHHHPQTCNHSNYKKKNEQINDF